MRRVDDKRLHVLVAAACAALACGAPSDDVASTSSTSTDSTSTDTTDASTSSIATTSDGDGTTGADTTDATGSVDTTDDCADTTLTLQSELASAVELNDGAGGGILRVATRDCVLFEGAAGAFEIDGDPLVADAGFEIASVTKTFTAVLVMTFVEDGSLALDTTLSDALGADAPTGLLVVDGDDHTAEITIRQLLSHTSGLPDYWMDNAFIADFDADPDHFWTPEEILAYVPGLTPIGLPGEQYHYCDTGYVLLGLLVEHLAGTTYDEAMRARILDPVGMPDTYLTYHEDPPRTLRESHRYEGDYDLFQVPRQSADWAGGGLASSTADLERFMFALVDGEILSDPSSWTAMTEWIPVGEPDVQYGLGLFWVDTGIVGEIIGHDGYGNSFMYYAPEPDVMFTGTLNQRDADWYPLFETALLELE